jgi:hypothetical protein
MKKTLVFTTSCLFLLFAVFTSCNSQTSDKSNDDVSAVQTANQESTTVYVYYFHGDRRCATCKAVGSVSKETIEDVFGDNSKVLFKDINIDDPENKEFKEKFEVSGSGLFIYDGENTEDLTALAFQKATSSPKELTEAIILAVNEML